MIDVILLANIKSLPSDLYVGGDLMVDDCPALLSPIHNGVFTHTDFNDDTIFGDLGADNREWCVENGITLKRSIIDVKPYRLESYCIPDDAEYMHYQLRWG